MQKGAMSRRTARRKDEMCHVQVEGNGSHTKHCDSDLVVWELEIHVASRHRK